MKVLEPFDGDNADYVFTFQVLWQPEHSGCAAALASLAGFEYAETPEQLADQLGLYIKRCVKRAAPIDCAVNILSIEEGRGPWQ